ncbi:MAG TPA: thiaminase II [Rhodospirillaceae bacterium]|nr:thiaminase II [Rhodospirillaceae bacterium]HAT36143.1 thiaminase II [Rhodospirillaceae bacterium]|tara:strand:- start:437 stop:1111 length:675 start_codon:yes stop_codon:yes gene_type:complete
MNGTNRFFDRLKQACPDAWEGYIRHPFVCGLGSGELPEAAFRHYLCQDYVFLIHFSRAYALAAYKADTLDEIRQAAETVSALAGHEMQLHIGYCKKWGIDEAALAATPEAPANLAYTRFVLERGQAGDLLDLQVALAPCVIGYAEIGKWLASDAATQQSGNPYGDWIEMYAGTEYQEVAAESISALDRLAAARGGDARFEALADTFRIATELEIGFWQMGLDAA